MPPIIQIRRREVVEAKCFYDDPKQAILGTFNNEVFLIIYRWSRRNVEDWVYQPWLYKLLGPIPDGVSLFDLLLQVPHEEKGLAMRYWWVREYVLCGDRT